MSLYTIKLSRSLSPSSSITNLLKRGFTPTLKSINQFLLFLVQTQRYSLVSYLISQMNDNNIQPNIQTHSIFTFALLKLNQFEDVEYFLKTQIGKASNFSKSLMWDSLIQGFCAHKKDPDRAFQALQDCLRNHGILPSSYTFCLLIHCFVSRGNTRRAIDLLELMNECNVKYPYSNFVCSSIISGLCKMGKPELALNFFENALSSGALTPNLVTYTAVVGSLCMLGRIDEVGGLVCKIENEGLAFDVVFYTSWICGYFREGFLMDAFRKHREMAGKGVNGDTISYTVLIDGFSKGGNVEKTAGILYKMLKKGLRPNLVTYTAIMSGFCKKGKINEALKVFRTIESLGLELDEFVYNVLIDGFCSKRDFDNVYQLLEEMEKKGINPSIITYNTLINGLCKSGRTSDADEFSKGIWGDNITYSSLLHGYIKEENITGILEVKRRAEEAGIQMDVVMCNTIIKALFMVGAFEDVHALYKGMEEMNLVADSVTYCAMISGYCKVGRINESLEIFDDFKVFFELNEKGLILYEGISMNLLKAVINNGNSEEVLNVIHSIGNRATVCNKAIGLLCKRRNFMVACEVFMVAKKNNLTLTAKSYYSIIKELFREKKLWLSLPFLSSFVKEYGLFEPKVSKIVLHYFCLKDFKNALYFLNKAKENEQVFSFPVNALRDLAKDGRVLAAYKLIIEAKDFLPFIGVIDFSMLVDSLCKGGHFFQALNLCCLAEEKGVALNIITYNSVINGLCNQGCFIEAFRLFDSLERIGLIPSEITFSTLIDHLCKEGYFQESVKLLEKMALKGYKTSIRVYNSFLIGYSKFGHVEEALKILKNIENDGLCLDEFSVSSLISGYCHVSNVEEALRFYSECKERGKYPDFLGFLYLMRGLSSKGRMEEARSVLREMLQSESSMELIKKVNARVETESIDGFLVLLCEQGSIREAIAVLNEVGNVFFPVQKFSISGNDESFEYSGENVLYPVIASLCSRGELGKANQLAKEMIGRKDGN